MSPLQLTLPPAAKVVFNHLSLYPKDYPPSGDLVLVQLPNGVEIDVSWHPDRRVYSVTAYRETLVTPLRPTVETPDARAAAAKVGRLAAAYAEPTAP